MKPFQMQCKSSLSILTHEIFAGSQNWINIQLSYNYSTFFAFNERKIVMQFISQLANDAFAGVYSILHLGSHLSYGMPKL